MPITIAVAVPCLSVNTGFTTMHEAPVPGSALMIQCEQKGRPLEHTQDLKFWVLNRANNTRILVLHKKGIDLSMKYPMDGIDGTIADLVGDFMKVGIWFQ